MDDEIIAQHITSPKRIVNPGARYTEQKGAKQKTFNVVSIDGENNYSVFLRQNLRFSYNFSCGISWHSQTGERLVLLRYNGSDHTHYNPIEDEILAAQCHIHRATKRYIDLGKASEHYAISTTKFSTLDSAFHCMLLDCNISYQTTANRENALFE